MDNITEKWLKGLNEGYASGKQTLQIDKETLQYCIQYISKGIEKGAYKETSGGDRIAENLLNILNVIYKGN